MYRTATLQATALRLIRYDDSHLGRLKGQLRATEENGVVCLATILSTKSANSLSAPALATGQGRAGARNTTVDRERQMLDYEHHILPQV